MKLFVPILVSILLLSSFSLHAYDASAKKPNIVLIMADDLGYGSLGCYGNNEIQTPNIDRLAACGIRLTDFHSNGSLCTPTRAALMTGRYQQRCATVRYEELSPIFREQRQQNPDQRWAWGISLDELTLPKLLHQSGYKTSLIGKWHLGYDHKFHPMNYGFDEFRGFVGGNVDYHTHIASHGTKELDWWKDRKIQNDTGYSTDLLSSYACDFISRNKSNPFFLYLAHGTPHNPWQGRNPSRKQSPVDTYKEMISTLDDSVGAVMKELKKHELESNTLLIFCSDNGPAPPRDFVATGNLRGRKNTLLEGGHRVPFIASWPHTIPQGLTSNIPVMTMDLLPTLANLAGATLPKDLAIDGIDILPILQGAKSNSPRDLYWQSGPDWAIRRGHWKLMGERNKPLSLVNLQNDIGEKNNLLKDEPTLVKELLQAHLQWVKSTTPASTSANRITKPNILLILADDLGVECLSAYGGTSHKTPNIDRLVQEGQRFTHCFSNPFCSPSRGTLLSGRYPFKNGLKVVLHSKNQEDIFLDPSQPSFARQLQQQGYATQIVGKWHLSLEHKHNTINQLGFDHYQTWQIFDSQGNKTTRYWNPCQMRDGRLLTNETIARYGPDVDLEVYLNFITENAKKKQPFLAYYATCLPHYPWEPTPDSKEQTYRAPYAGHKGDPKYFPDMLAYLDKQIGTMLQTLDDLNIANNTIVIFLADNGTDRDLLHNWGDRKKVSGGKGTLTDRGTHVPLIVRWPGHINAGSICNDLIDFSDLFPTLCELTGSQLPADEIHGHSFAPQLLGKTANPRQWIHIQNGADRQIRNSDYMLNNKGQLRRVVELWEDPAKPNANLDPEKEEAARKILQAAFKLLE